MAKSKKDATKLYAVYQTVVYSFVVSARSATEAADVVAATSLDEASSFEFTDCEVYEETRSGSYKKVKRND